MIHNFSVQAHNSVLFALAKAGKFREMVSWYQKEMRTNDHVVPDEIIFKTLVEYGLRSGDEVVIATIKNELEKEKMSHLMPDPHKVTSHAKITI